MNSKLYSSIILLLVIGCGPKKRPAQNKDSKIQSTQTMQTSNTNEREKKPALEIKENQRPELSTTSAISTNDSAPQPQDQEPPKIAAVPAPTAETDAKITRIPHPIKALNISPPVAAPKVTAEPPKKPEQTAAPETEPEIFDKKKSGEKVRNTLNDLAATAEKKEPVDQSDQEKDLWIKLVDYVADNGEKGESMAGFYVSLSERTAPTRFEKHIANHISVIGGPDGKGHFAFSRVEAVWESWQVTKDDLMEGDQWMFLLSRNGNVAKYWRYHFLKKKNDTVLEHQSLSITEEEANKKWSEMKAQWFKKIQAIEAAKTTQK